MRSQNVALARREGRGGEGGREGGREERGKEGGREGGLKGPTLKEVWLTLLATRTVSLSSRSTNISFFCDLCREGV